MNILILSCGTRNKIIQYFKNETKNGVVVVTDCNQLAPALYEADKYYIVPKITDKKYLDTIISICKSNNINAVLSLIDPELSFIAKNIRAFTNIGVIPIVSDYSIVNMCMNKYIFYRYLKFCGFSTLKSYIQIERFYRDISENKIHYPVIVKPICGSASFDVKKVSTKEEIETIFTNNNGLMIQEFMDGKEYGADIYIDLLSHEPVSIFIKEKILMRAGETDKSISIKDYELFKILNYFVRKVGFKGVIDVDIFKKNGNYYISEVNPRFGGGYPHAYECGINIPKMIKNNIYGVINKPCIGCYDEDVFMMKFFDVKILNKDSLNVAPR